MHVVGSLLQYVKMRNGCLVFKNIYCKGALKGKFAHCTSAQPSAIGCLAANIFSGGGLNVLEIVIDILEKDHCSIENSSISRIF
jgi:hypothetical protein